MTKTTGYWEQLFVYKNGQEKKLKAVEKSLIESDDVCVDCRFKKKLKGTPGMALPGLKSWSRIFTNRFLKILRGLGYEVVKIKDKKCQ